LDLPKGGYAYFAPLVVKLLDAGGKPLSNAIVRWTVQPAPGTTVTPVRSGTDIVSSGTPPLRLQFSDNYGAGIETKTDASGVADLGLTNRTTFLIPPGAAVPHFSMRAEGADGLVFIQAAVGDTAVLFRLCVGPKALGDRLLPVLKIVSGDGQTIQGQTSPIFMQDFKASHDLGVVMHNLGGMLSTLAVQLFDAAGKPWAGQTIAWRPGDQTAISGVRTDIPDPNSYAELLLAAPSSVTDGRGIAELTGFTGMPGTPYTTFDGCACVVCPSVSPALEEDIAFEVTIEASAGMAVAVFRIPVAWKFVSTEDPTEGGLI
jgi:hypothetical protein